MHTAVYETSSNSERVDLPKDLQTRLLDVPYLTLLMQWLGHQTTKLLLQQFPHDFILNWTLGLTIYLKIHQNSSAWPQPVTPFVTLGT